MDDETQYRCAGFLQAEIEQFVDDLAAGGERLTTTEDESSHAGSASEGDQDMGGKKGKKAKRGRPRKVIREDTPGASFRVREYVNYRSPLTFWLLFGRSPYNATLTT